MTRREEIIELLRKGEHCAYDLAIRFRVKEKLILDDMAHIQKSLKHKEGTLVITAAECRECGFCFQNEAIKNPSKCPKCSSEWIQEQVYRIE